MLAGLYPKPQFFWGVQPNTLPEMGTRIGTEHKQQLIPGTRYCAGYLKLRQDPMVCPEGQNGVQTLSIDMLKYLRRTTKPKPQFQSLKPQTLTP